MSILDEDRDEDLDIDLDEDEGEGKKPKKPEPKSKDEDDDEPEVEVEGDDDEPADDERLGQDMRQGEESDEERRERRRNEKKQKKQNRRNYERSERLLVASLSDELRKTQEQLSKLQGKVASDDAAAIAQQADYWARQVNRLTRVRGKAVAEGDGETFAKAEYDLNDALQRANYYSQLKNAPSQPEGQEATKTVNPVIIDFAQQFADRNPWYDGENAASQLVMRLDAQMTRQGWDATTPEYWQTLEEEAYKRLPKDFQKYRSAPDEDDDGEDEPAPQRGKDGRFKGPPAGGRTATRGTGEPKPGSVRISKAFKESLVQAGLWDDKAARNRAIKEHLRLKKEMGLR